MYVCGLLHYTSRRIAKLLPFRMQRRAFHRRWALSHTFEMQILQGSQLAIPLPEQYAV